MSAPEEQVPVEVEQIPVQVQSVMKNVFMRFKDIKVDIKPVIEDLVTFLSIIGAYQFISLSYNQSRKFEQWAGISLSNKRTQAILLLIFAIYLITLKLAYRLAYSYDTAPPKKVIPQNWQQLQDQPQQQPTPVPSPTQQPIQIDNLPIDSYSRMINQLINNSIYSVVFVFCTTAYTYVSLFNKKNKLVNLQQVNYLVFWFIAANIFYSAGKIIGKLTGIKTFHHFGLMLGFLVVVMEIGLAHGFNTFIFI